MSIFDALILGIVEGLTEFLPISSTAHLVIAAKLLGIDKDKIATSFSIVSQLAAILSVVWIYKDKLFGGFGLWFKVGISFVPTGLAGLFLYDYITALFVGFYSVLFMALMGVLFLAFEYLHKNTKDEPLGYKHTIIVGLSQIFSLLPGISRSGITIIAGMASGLGREKSVEFSFLLGIVTIFIASFYELYKNFEVFAQANTQALIVGFFASFLSSYLVIKWFLSFIKRNDFKPFGIYLITFSFVHMLFI